MGHKYVKEEDTFSTSQNGTVPKPTAAEVSANKFLRADGSWASGGGGGGGGGASEFADLDDVSFSNLQNGQIPKYNSTTQKWENANESGGGGSVTDVEVNGVSVVNQQGVAEIVSYKELTQAQYNALPSSKLTDNIMYCIKDARSNPGHNYSTAEQVVGTWIDGSPVYERTAVWTNPQKVNGWVFCDVTNWGITQYISVEGMTKVYGVGSALFVEPLPRNCPDAESQYAIGQGDFTLTEIGVLYGTGYGNVAEIMLIVRYLKS